MTIDDAIKEAEEDLEQFPESPLRRQHLALLRFVQAWDAHEAGTSITRPRAVLTARAALDEALQR
jgi:hypothetical protein